MNSEAATQEDPLNSEATTREEQSEQLVYARVLEIGMYIGLVLLFVTFALYVSRVVAPAVPLEQVSNYWSHGVHEYLEEVNEDFLHMEHPPTGWAWVTMLGKGDFLRIWVEDELSAVRELRAKVHYSPAEGHSVEFEAWDVAGNSSRLLWPFAAQR